MANAPSKAPVAADQRTTPIAGAVLAYAAIVPMAACGIAAWAIPPEWRPHCIRLAIVWSGAILSFLAGVRRGDSFHSTNGPRPEQLVAVFGVFAFALAGLAMPQPALAIIALIAGFAGMGLLDATAARHGAAPRFFARIRPPQAAIAVISLAILLAAALR